MPRSPTRPPSPAARALADRLAMDIGTALADERRRRALTTRQLAERARLSAASIDALDAGRRLSLDAYARVASALGVPLEVVIGQMGGGRRERTDLVHAAMGEREAAMLHRLGYDVAIDHPYQHYQFAGRADVLAWTRDPPAVLHIENRTRFPDLQEVAGSFNAKREYLAPVVARGLGLPRFVSEAHVIAALWSGEVLRTLRAAPASFRALCPDGPSAWEAWLAGDLPPAGRSSTLVLLDPFARGRQRAWIAFEQGLRDARPRMRGYADAADRARSAR